MTYYLELYRQTFWSHPIYCDLNIIRHILIKSPILYYFLFPFIDCVYNKFPISRNTKNYMLRINDPISYGSYESNIIL